MLIIHPQSECDFLLLLFLIEWKLEESQSDRMAYGNRFQRVCVYVTFLPFLEKN